MRTNLPTDLLRSFVAIAECGSISQAAKEVCLTQSALSLQMKRLSELTQTNLFDRHFRGVMLTSSGKTMLSYAQAILNLNDLAMATLSGKSQQEPIRIGMIQDFADGVLPNVLIRFSQIYPDTQLQIRVGNSTELLALLAGGLVDLAICLAAPDDPAALIKPPLLWLGHQTLPYGETLPLILMEKPCLFRDNALKVLTEHGVPYRIVMETPNLGVLCAAVAAAIGVTCRTAAFLPGRLPILHSLDLPLPNIGVALHSLQNPSRQVQHLAKLIRSTILSFESQAPLAPAVGYNAA